VDREREKSAERQWGLWERAFRGRGRAGKSCHSGKLTILAVGVAYERKSGQKSLDEGTKLKKKTHSLEVIYGGVDISPITKPSQKTKIPRGDRKRAKRVRQKDSTSVAKRKGDGEKSRGAND